MSARASTLRRGMPPVLVALVAGAALLPIAARSREIESRARLLNESFPDAGHVRTVADRPATQRVEGTPREVFAWLRGIEAAPPPSAFTVDLSIVPSPGEEPTLVAELHTGSREIDR